MPTVLSVQSRVAYGHVGNAASVFPLQRLGPLGRVPVVVARLFNLYGPHDSVGHLIPTVVAQARGRHLQRLDDGGGGDAGVVHCHRGGDDRDQLDGIAGDLGRDGGEFERKDLFHGEVLRGQDAVETFE